MKHDPASFAGSYASAQSYSGATRDVVEDRVRRFLPLVRRSAWHIYGMGRAGISGGIEIEDLIQTGILALTECAQRHGRESEDGFAAYAKIRVRGAMLDQIRRLLNDSRLARKKRAAYERACDALRERLGRDPSRREIARAMRITDSELLEIEASAITLSSITDEYDETNTAFAAEGPDPFEALCEMEDRERLVAAMARLPERLTLVLQLFYVEELNLTEIAQVLEVSVPRVHQLRAKALGDLKKLMQES
jgi:RNA polymerase sigma factor for flagellar operon FliA